jgi:hypothetical protein
MAASLLQYRPIPAARTARNCCHSWPFPPLRPPLWLGRSNSGQGEFQAQRSVGLCCRPARQTGKGPVMESTTVRVCLAYGGWLVGGDSAPLCARRPGRAATLPAAAKIRRHRNWPESAQTHFLLWHTAFLMLADSRTHVAACTME